jgi:hypothetical protein
MLARSLLLGSAPLLCLFALGCSSSSATDPASSSGSSGSASGSSSSGSGSSSSGAFDAGGVVTSYDTGIGPISVMPGDEKTECITIRLQNPDVAYIRRLKADLGGSHHMIVYRSNATTEIPDPVKCQGLGGILNGDDPIFIAQQASATLEFPDEGAQPVAFKIEPHQMVKIELHFINPQPSEITVNGKATIDTIPGAADIIESDIAFWGTQALNAGGSPPSTMIPANSAGDTGVKFQHAYAGTKSFAVTTHQHHLGKRMRVWYGTGTDAAMGMPVADSSSWSDPPLVQLNPPLDFPVNGSAKTSQQGFAYECQYQNTTPNPVGFGESVNNEMCFLWHYYYPAKGANICFDGLCK